ncbi:MAG: pirin family protein [Alphaproteobacteria bacterium]|nr:pirin family protein [Alphaproteobacteria bacterium]
MKTLRLFKDIGHTDLGWLKSGHTFSFASYYDPKWMGFGHLRVINNDRVEGGGGFAPHSHDNMEIISYVTEGGLAHGDSLGNKSVIPYGSIQLMSAGSGITHSEYNDDSVLPVKFYQIWIKPNVRNEAPTYQEKSLFDIDATNQLVPLVTPDGRDGTLLIRQDATLSLGRFKAGETLTLPKTDTRDVWVQVVEGQALWEGQTLADGDGLGIRDEDEVSISFAKPTELLVFSMGR